MEVGIKMKLMKKVTIEMACSINSSDYERYKRRIMRKRYFSLKKCWISNRI